MLPSLRPLVLALTLALLEATSSAHAEPAAEADPAARAAFEQGASAYEHGRFAEALAAFERSYALSHHPKLLFNIGRAADGDGQAERAISAYDAYLLAYPNADNRDFVRSRLDKLRTARAEPAKGPRVEEPASPTPPLAPLANPSATDLRVTGAPATSADQARPWYKRSWVWIVGGVVTAGAITGIVLAASAGGGGDDRVRSDQRVEALEVGGR
jgi:tetratricopeptide (TPR) repeat protein